MVGRLVSDQSEKIWKEAVTVIIRVMSWHLPGRAEEKKKENPESGESGYLVSWLRFKLSTSS
jgi:hypothetical protein